MKQVLVLCLVTASLFSFQSKADQISDVNQMIAKMEMINAEGKRGCFNGGIEYGKNEENISNAETLKAQNKLSSEQLKLLEEIKRIQTRIKEFCLGK